MSRSEKCRNVENVCRWESHKLVNLGKVRVPLLLTWETLQGSWYGLWGTPCKPLGGVGVPLGRVNPPRGLKPPLNVFMGVWW